MPKYRVQLRGENFFLNLTGEPDLLGFRVVHYVSANSEAEAERIAIIHTRQNRQLHEHLQNIPQNPSRLTCESIRRVWWRRSARDGRYQFWVMEQSDTAEVPD
jgi:hypothetical protein